MALSMAEKIRIVLGRRNMTVTELAAALGQSRQNMSNKMARDNFTEKELIEIAGVLNCTYRASLIMNDTGEDV